MTLTAASRELCWGNGTQWLGGIQGRVLGTVFQLQTERAAPGVTMQLLCTCLVLSTGFWPGRLRVSMGGKERGLAGSRLAVCMKIHAFARLASNIKNNSWREEDGMQCTGHMFGTPAHNGWLRNSVWCHQLRLNYGTLWAQKSGRFHKLS